MVASSPNNENIREILEGQLRQSFGQVVYTHKTQEKCADLLLERLGTLRFLQTLLSAMTTTGFIVAIFSSLQWIIVVGAIVSTSLLCLNVYTKDYDLSAAAEAHRRAANEMWLIREKYLTVLSDLMMSRISVDDARKIRDDLTGDLHLIYTGAPRTNFRAYTLAQKSLKSSEDMTFSEREIDAFLPYELKRIKPQSR